MDTSLPQLHIKRKHTELLFTYCLDQKLPFSAKPVNGSEEIEFTVDPLNINNAIEFGMFLRENRIDLNGTNKAAAQVKATRKAADKQNGRVEPVRSAQAEEKDGIGADILPEPSLLFGAELN